jgi:hypothetical protein
MATAHPHAEAAYKLITQDDGGFAVEVTVPDTEPTKVTGFDTQAKAEAWIERHKANVATGSLRGVYGQPFRRRSS